MKIGNGTRDMHHWPEWTKMPLKVRFSSQHWDIPTFPSLSKQNTLLPSICGATSTITAAWNWYCHQKTTHFHSDKVNSFLALSCVVATQYSFSSSTIGNKSMVGHPKNTNFHDALRNSYSGKWTGFAKCCWHMCALQASKSKNSKYTHTQSFKKNTSVYSVITRTYCSKSKDPHC